MSSSDRARDRAIDLCIHVDEVTTQIQLALSAAHLADLVAPTQAALTGLADSRARVDDVLTAKVRRGRREQWAADLDQCADALQDALRQFEPTRLKVHEQAALPVTVEELSRAAGVAYQRAAQAIATSSADRSVTRRWQRVTDMAEEGRRRASQLAGQGLWQQAKAELLETMKALSSVADQAEVSAPAAPATAVAVETLLSRVRERGQRLADAGERPWDVSAAGALFQQAAPLLGDDPDRAVALLEEALTLLDVGGPDPSLGQPAADAAEPEPEPAPDDAQGAPAQGAAADGSERTEPDTEDEAPAEPQSGASTGAGGAPVEVSSKERIEQILAGVRAHRLPDKPAGVGTVHRE